jgi:hypothetical protein
MRDKIDLRKEVILFMEKQGIEWELKFDGNPISFGTVIELIDSFYEKKTELDEPKN